MARSRKSKRRNSRHPAASASHHNACSRRRIGRRQSACPRPSCGRNGGKSALKRVKSHELSGHRVDIQPRTLRWQLEIHSTHPRLSRVFSHILDPKPKSSTRRVSALCANGDRDGPDCASAPNSKPSNGERSDPNNSKSPRRIRESRASRAQCGSSTSVVRLRPLVPTARYTLVARRTSLRPPR